MTADDGKTTQDSPGQVKDVSVPEAIKRGIRHEEFYLRNP